MDATAEAFERIIPDRVIELARGICAARPADGSEGPVAEYIAEALERTGVEVHVEEVVAGRPNVVATVRGAGRRPPLVLNGHLDAAIVHDGWRNPPDKPWIEGGRLHGGAITDMLGAVASMVAAVEPAATMDPLPGDLILQAVMHHDTVGLGAKYVLASEGPEVGYAICGEPSNLAIHTANGGALKFEIALTGRTAHVSRVEDGVDALAAAVRVYDAVRAAEFPHEPHPRLPDLPRLLVGELHAGTAPGSVADTAVVRGDLRIVPGMERSAVRARLVELVDDVCPPAVGRRVRITAVQRPFVGATDGPLIDALSAAHTAVRGRPPRVTHELPGQAFVTDAADLARHGLETVVYGPGDWSVVPNESVPVTDLVDAARIYLAAAALLEQ